jgi:hypothetical protein
MPGSGYSVLGYQMGGMLEGTVFLRLAQNG